MIINVTSTNKDNSSKFDLYFSTDRATVWASPAAMTNSTGEFTFELPQDKTMYYIGVAVTNSSGKVYWEPILKFYNINDWGPLTPAVISNMEKYKSPYIQGWGDMGAITPPYTAEYSLPTLTDNIPLDTFKRWLTESGAPASTSISYNSTNTLSRGMVLGGKLISYRSPLIQTGDVAITSNPPETFSKLSEYVHALKVYLESLSDGSDIVTVNGYRWQFKLMTADFIKDHLSIFIADNSDVDVEIPFFTAKFQYPVAAIFPSSTVSEARTLTWVNKLPNLVVINRNSGSSAPLPYYFEYLGPA